MREIALERTTILIAQFANAAGKRHVAEITALLREIRMLQHIAADHDVAPLLRGARIRPDAAYAMANVGRVGRLAHLAIAHDVDAGGNLFSDHIVDRFCRFGFEARRIDRAASFTRQNELGQGFGPRQAAGVGGENPILRGFHAGALPRLVLLT